MSEVARLRQQIELRSQAMKRLMTDFATTATHEIINNRYRAIGEAHDQLAAIVGSVINQHFYCRLVIWGEADRSQSTLMHQH